MNHGAAAQADDQYLLLFRTKDIAEKHVFRVIDEQLMRPVEIHHRLNHLFSGIAHEVQRTDVVHLANAHSRIVGPQIRFDIAPSPATLYPGKHEPKPKVTRSQD